MAAQTQSDLDKFQKKLEDFYNNAMDRCGGVYKKKMSVILFVAGFVIAFSMNLDTIRISQDALGDKQKLGQTVDKIVSQIPGITSGKGQITIKKGSGSIIISQNQDTTDTSKKAVDLNKKIKAVNDLSVYLQQNAGISFGYTNWDSFSEKWNFWSESFRHLGDVALSLLGIIITTLALQLSSNFWFDLLNKFVNVRAAGQKPKTDNK